MKLPRSFLRPLIHQITYDKNHHLENINGRHDIRPSRHLSTNTVCPHLNAVAFIHPSNVVNHEPPSTNQQSALTCFYPEHERRLRFAFFVVRCTASGNGRLQERERKRNRRCRPRTCLNRVRGQQNGDFSKYDWKNFIEIFFHLISSHFRTLYFSQ